MKHDTIIEDLERERLPEIAADLTKQGYRFVQMMGTPREETIELMVSFDKNYELKNFRIQVPRSDLKIPSMTGATLAAFSYENELQDLFGMEVSDLAINYGGNFLRTKSIHPLADMVDPKVGKRKTPAPAGDSEKKRTVKTIPLAGVNCETVPEEKKEN
jgi:ech hydrogenase subunit D